MFREVCLAKLRPGLDQLKLRLFIWARKISFQSCLLKTKTLLDSTSSWEQTVFLISDAVHQGLMCIFRSQCGPRRVEEAFCECPSVVRKQLFPQIKISCTSQYDLSLCLTMVEPELGFPSGPVQKSMYPMPGQCHLPASQERMKVLYPSQNYPV